MGFCSFLKFLLGYLFGSKVDNLYYKRKEVVIEDDTGVVLEKGLRKGVGRLYAIVEGDIYGEN